MMGLELFTWRIDGSAKSWKEFGQWYSSEILTTISEKTS
jgi:hypothetical protein